MDIKDIYKEYKEKFVDKAYLDIKEYNLTKNKTDESLFFEYLISYTHMSDLNNKEYLDFFEYSFLHLRDRKKIVAKFLVEITYELGLFKDTRKYINFLETREDYTEDIFDAYKVRIMIYVDKKLDKALELAKKIVLNNEIESIIRNDALLSIYDIYKEYNDKTKLNSLEEFTNSIKDTYDSPQAIFYNNLDLGVYYKLGLEYFDENLEELRYYTIYMSSYIDLIDNLLDNSFYSVANIYLSDLLSKVDDDAKVILYNDYLTSLSLSGEIKKALDTLENNIEFNEVYLEDNEYSLIKMGILSNSIYHKDLYLMQKMFDKAEEIYPKELSNYINSYVRLGDYRFSNYLVETYIDEFSDPTSSLSIDCLEAYLIYLKTINNNKEITKVLENSSLDYIRRTLLEIELLGEAKITSISKVFSKEEEYNIDYSLLKLKSYIYGTFSDVDYSKAHSILEQMKYTGQNKDIVDLYSDILNYKENNLSFDIFSRYYDRFLSKNFSETDDISLSMYLLAINEKDPSKALEAALKISSVYNLNKREVAGDNIAATTSYILLKANKREEAIDILESHSKKGTFTKTSVFAVLCLLNKDSKKPLKHSLKEFKSSLVNSSNKVKDYYKDSCFDKLPIILDY